MGVATSVTFGGMAGVGVAGFGDDPAHALDTDPSSTAAQAALRG
jgi:hypothetical protein